MSEIWNRCLVCGQFIGFDELEEGTAVHHMVTPDSDVSSETYETYHVRCVDERT
jgi:hypothetical protein